MFYYWNIVVLNIYRDAVKYIGVSFFVVHLIGMRHLISFIWITRWSKAACEHHPRTKFSSICGIDKLYSFELLNLDPFFSKFMLSGLTRGIVRFNHTTPKKKKCWRHPFKNQVSLRCNAIAFHGREPNHRCPLKNSALLRIHQWWMDQKQTESYHC